MVWEGEAPAEPQWCGRARLWPSHNGAGGRGSGRATMVREGEAPAEPQWYGRARLRPSRAELTRLSELLEQGQQRAVERVAVPILVGHILTLRIQDAEGPAEVPQCQADAVLGQDLEHIA